MQPPEKYDKGTTRQKVELYLSLHDLSEHTQQLLENSEEVSDLQRRKLNVLHFTWTRFFVMNYTVLKEMDTYSADGFSTCPADHIAVELWRIYYIINYQKIEQYMQWSIKEHAPQSISSTWQFHDVLEVPIMDFTVMEVAHSIQECARLIYQLPLDKELRKLIDLLWLRYSHFMSIADNGDNMDDENYRMAVEEGNDNAAEQRWVPNEEYIHMGCIYFEALQRRLFYLEVFNRWHPLESMATQQQVAYFKQWCERRISIMGDDSFSERYAEAAELAYSYPGDKPWFLHAFPMEPPTIGLILQHLRGKPERDRYFVAAGNTSKETAISKPDEMATKWLVLRMFCLYLRTQYGMDFRSGYLIKNEALEQATPKLRRKHTPLLVQVVADFWLVMDRKLYKGESIYHTLANWLCYHRRYQTSNLPFNKLLGDQDI